MIILTLVVFLVLAIYYYSIRNHKYWQNKGVAHDKPIPLFGNNARNYLMQKSVTEISVEMYCKFPTEKVVGFYRGPRPELLIRDPEIVKRILVTDFPYFYLRGFIQDKYNIEPMLKNLLFTEGDMWRLLRQCMTPAFTSSKLKAMFPLIVESAERLQERALEGAAAGRPLDACDLMARYTVDFIGACGFGLDSRALKQENSFLRKLGSTIFHIGFKEVFIVALKELIPSLFKNLKIMARVEKGINQIVTEVLKQRNYEPSGRNDFIDLLLECKRQGIVVGESIERIGPDGKPETTSLEMDDELIAAQVFVFFAAGFETSSSATSITLHELAHNSDVQAKVQNEIDVVLAKYNNKLCYDAINEMQYLMWTLKEGMRIFPSPGYLTRECARKYTFEDLGLTIDAGVKILVPIEAIHNDSKYFDDPNKFRPERFDPKIADLKTKYAYFPFGSGPRACIGERLGLMQSLAGLAAVLSRFTVRPAPTTRRRPQIDPAFSIVQILKGGLPLMFLERKPNTFLTQPIAKLHF